jgi:hypothetical protein
MELLELQLLLQYTTPLHLPQNVAISVILVHNGMDQAVNQNQVLDDEVHDEVVQHEDEDDDEVQFRLVLMQNSCVKMGFFTSNLGIFVLEETLQKLVSLKNKFGEKIL